MKVRALRTLENILGEPLFVEGKAYDVIEEDSKFFWAANELRSESPIYKDKLAGYFELIQP